jgi:hypothetical protein
MGFPSIPLSKPQILRLRSGRNGWSTEFPVDAMLYTDQENASRACAESPLPDRHSCGCRSGIFF